MARILKQHDIWSSWFTVDRSHQMEPRQPAWTAHWSIKNEGVSRGPWTARARFPFPSACKAADRRSSPPDPHRRPLPPPAPRQPTATFSSNSGKPTFPPRSACRRLQPSSPPPAAQFRRQRHLHSSSPMPLPSILCRPHLLAMAAVELSSHSKRPSRRPLFTAPPPAPSPLHSGVDHAASGATPAPPSGVGLPCFIFIRPPSSPSAFFHRSGDVTTNHHRSPPSSPRLPPPSAVTFSHGRLRPHNRLLSSTVPPLFSFIFFTTEALTVIFRPVTSSSSPVPASIFSTGDVGFTASHHQHHFLAPLSQQISSQTTGHHHQPGTTAHVRPIQPTTRSKRSPRRIGLRPGQLDRIGS